MKFQDLIGKTAFVTEAASGDWPRRDHHVCGFRR